MQDPDRSRSAVIAGANNSLPPATLAHPGCKWPIPHPPPPQVSMRPPPPCLRIRGLGVSSSYPDSTPDDAILDERDQARDFDPDAWVSEDESPAPLPSRGGVPSPVGGNQLPGTSRLHSSPTSSPDFAVGQEARATLAAVNMG